jgi:hypothetical protein
MVTAIVLGIHHTRSGMTASHADPGYSFTKGSQTVTIIESKLASATRVVLGGVSTASMVVLTARRAFIFYPTLTLEHRAALRSGCVVADTTQIQQWKTRGIKLADEVSGLGLDECGEGCPGITRQVNDGRLGIVMWNPRGREGEALERGKYSWGLGPTGRRYLCFNKTCKNYGLGQGIGRACQA